MKALEFTVECDLRNGFALGGGELTREILGRLRVPVGIKGSLLRPAETNVSEAKP
jgi:hypothetical protein